MNSLLQRAKNAPISKSKKDRSSSTNERDLAIAWVNGIVSTHQVRIAIDNTNVYGFLANTLADVVRQQQNSTLQTTSQVTGLSSRPHESYGVGFSR